MGVSVDDFLSVMSLLTGPKQEFLRRVYYRRSEFGQVEELPANEVIRQTRRWRPEQKIDENEWKQWADNILVGWEPTLNKNVM
jgi:hypothetical protein